MKREDYWLIPYYERGWDYYKTKEYEKAVDEWEHVLALVPSYQGLDALLEKTRYKSVEIKVRALIDNARKNYDKENYKKSIGIIAGGFEFGAEAGRSE